MRGPLTQTDAAEVRPMFADMSKGALFDLVVHLVRRELGADLDGEDLARAIAERFEPVRRVRRDAVPRIGHAPSGQAATDRILAIVRTSQTVLEQPMPSELLVQALRLEGWTTEQGRQDVRRLVAEGQIERVIQDGAVAYRCAA